jgi:hypothetical protein
MNDLERLQQLRKEATENPAKKAKGCKDCKKGKDVVVEPKTTIEEEIYIPSVNDIKLAYAELTSFGGIKEDKKDFINKVYSSIFGISFDFGCRGCGNKEVVKFTNYMMKNNIRI